MEAIPEGPEPAALRRRAAPRHMRLAARELQGVLSPSRAAATAVATEKSALAALALSPAALARLESACRVRQPASRDPPQRTAAARQPLPRRPAESPRRPSASAAGARRGLRRELDPDVLISCSQALEETARALPLISELLRDIRRVYDGRLLRLAKRQVQRGDAQRARLARRRARRRRRRSLARRREAAAAAAATEAALAADDGPSSTDPSTDAASDSDASSSSAGSETDERVKELSKWLDDMLACARMRGRLEREESGDGGETGAATDALPADIAVYDAGMRVVTAQLARSASRGARGNAEVASLLRDVWFTASTTLRRARAEAAAQAAQGRAERAFAAARLREARARLKEVRSAVAQAQRLARSGAVVEGSALLPHEPRNAERRRLAAELAASEARTRDLWAAVAEIEQQMASAGARGGSSRSRGRS